MPLSPARRRVVRRVALAALAATVVTGCGSDEGSDGSERPGGITDQQGGQIELRMSRERVAELLAEDPVLTAEPSKGSAGGCEFYAMSGRPLSNVWQFCFDERDEVTLGVTQFSPQQPDPPEDASAAREALIARADAICQASYGDLRETTRDVTRALRKLDETESKANRAAAAEAISRFVANLRRTHASLSDFEAPDDALESLDGYLDALESQTEVLGEARQALLEGDDETYDTLGDEFNELARTAKDEAGAYGFTICSASTFG